MRKSERLRLLELQVVRMEMHLELMSLTLENLLESQGMEQHNLDSGKWYQAKMDSDK